MPTADTLETLALELVGAGFRWQSAVEWLAAESAGSSSPEYLGDYWNTEWPLRQRAVTWVLTARERWRTNARRTGAHREDGLDDIETLASVLAKSFDHDWRAEAGRLARIAGDSALVDMPLELSSREWAGVGNAMRARIDLWMTRIRSDLAAAAARKREPRR